MGAPGTGGAEQNAGDVSGRHTLRIGRILFGLEAIVAMFVLDRLEMAGKNNVGLKWLRWEITGLGVGGPQREALG